MFDDVNAMHYNAHLRELRIDRRCVTACVSGRTRRARADDDGLDRAQRASEVLHDHTDADSRVADLRT